MDIFEKNVISIIKSALFGSPIQIEGEIDYGAVFDFAIDQQLVCILFDGLSNREDFKACKEYKKFIWAYINCTEISNWQLQEINGIQKAFAEKNIKCLFLKGAYLKTLYGKPEYREMIDADVLINFSDYNAISDALTELGFTFTEESDHELVWQKEDRLYLELHKHLIPSYNKDFYGYYGEGLTKIGEDGLSPEENFVYLFTHFAKHYRDKGVGIKYLLDFFFFKKRFPNLDESKVIKSLEIMHLSEFYENIMHVIDVWFNDAKGDEKTDFITESLFACGIHGNKEYGLYSDGVKLKKYCKNVKRKKRREFLFPPYRNLCNKFKILKYLVIFMPLIYLLRLVFVVLFRRKNLKTQLEKLKYYDDERISAYERALNYVGLDYNFDK